MDICRDPVLNVCDLSRGDVVASDNKFVARKFFQLWVQRCTGCMSRSVLESVFESAICRSPKVPNSPSLVTLVVKPVGCMLNHEK